MSNESARTLLTSEEVAARLRLSPAQVAELARTRQLTPLLMFGQTRFDSSDVTALILTYKKVSSRRNHGFHEAQL
jgi:hypothetical protein